MDSETFRTAFVLPDDVPPLLQDAVDSLCGIISHASRMRRNTQKILHFIARCVEIIENLKGSINEQPPTFEEMMAVIESVRKLEILLVSCEGAISHEVSSSECLNIRMMATWESTRTDFRELLNEAHHPEFKPPSNWEREVEDVMRIDDYLWAHLLALDIRSKGTNPDRAQRADYIAARILGENDQVTRNEDIEAVIGIWRTSMRDRLLGEAKKTFEVVEAGSEAFPVIGRFVGVAAKVGLAFVKMVETMSENEDVSEDLASHTEKLSLCLEYFRRRVDAEQRGPTREDAEEEGEVTTHIEDLSKELERAQETVNTWKSSESFKKLLLSGDDAGDPKATQGTVQTALERMQLLVSLKTADIVAELADTESRAERARLLGSLGDGTYGARKTAIAEVTCLPGTRVEILDRIYEWIRDTSTYEERVLWIRGAAGRGKSTIASTVAHNWISKGSCAIFCFRRGQHELDGHFLCALARQLGEDLVPEVRNAILDCVRENEDIARQPLDTQFETLFFGALGRIQNHTHPIVIVVDALDECKDVKDAVDFIQLIKKHSSVLPPNIKFLLTCHPEPSLLLALEKGKWITEDLDSISHTFEDIKRYTQHAFAQIRDKHKLPPPWPSQTDVEAIVGMSQELFQWAHTAIAYIDDGSPSHRLQELLQDQPKWVGLNNLYHQILSKAFKNAEKKPQRKEMLSWVLGTLVVAPHPVTLQVIAFLYADHQIFEGKEGIIHFISDDILADVNPLLYIPKSDSDSEPVHLMHTSIRDLLESREGLESQVYSVDPVHNHRRLATISLQIMERDLKQNICDLPQIPIANFEIQDSVDNKVTKGLRYCCRSWSTHLTVGATCSDGTAGATSSELAKFKLFSNNKLLYWLEVMSLIGALNEAYRMAKQIHQWLQEQPQDISDEALTSLWEDTQRFIVAFFTVISFNPSEIYASALPRCPVDTRLWSVYHAQATALIPGGNLNQHWGANIGRASAGSSVETLVSSPGKSQATSETSGDAVQLWDVKTEALWGSPPTGHRNPIIFIAFSPNGKILASVSGDKTIQLWDAHTGAPLGNCLTGHSDLITSVALSPDGKALASGSFDKTIRLWDVQTGATLDKPLTDHGNSIFSIAFSPDGKVLASGSNDHTIRLWDALTVAPLGYPLTGHSNSITSVELSPSGKSLASGLDGKTVQLWDALTGASLRNPLTDHSDWITSVAFTPDGKILASGSDDHTIRLWDAETRAPLGYPLPGYSNSITSVKSSPSGKSLLLKSDDKTIWLWDALTGTMWGKPLTAHGNSITSVTFSPDGKILASVSDGKTIQLWDAQTGAPLGNRLTGHSDLITSVALSPDGKALASGSIDETVRLWDVQTGATLGKPLTIHDSSVTSLTFSPDGKILASGLDDMTIQLWNAQTRAPLGNLPTDHSDMITSVAFSPDGKALVSGSFGKSVRLWDAKIRMPLSHPLIGHGNSVTSVVFSPDDKVPGTRSFDKTVRGSRTAKTSPSIVDVKDTKLSFSTLPTSSQNPLEPGSNYYQ